MFRVQRKNVKIPLDEVVDARSELDKVESELECPMWMLGAVYKRQLGKRRWELIHKIARLEKEW